MPTNPTLQDLLARYRDGKISLDAAAEAIEGLRLERVGDFACLDLAGMSGAACLKSFLLKERTPITWQRSRSVSRKRPAGAWLRALTRAQARLICRRAAQAGIPAEYRETGHVLVAGKGPAPKPTGGIVAIITAGTSDIRVAEEARIIAEEMGCVVRTAYDVGAAGIHRLFPALRPLLGAHAFIVCAGREGTLPAVVAGLVDKPVIGVPVSVGYGYMGHGQAALASMLQSCSVVAVVNIDAGFTAGAFAARIANNGASLNGVSP